MKKNQPITLIVLSVMWFVSCESAKNNPQKLASPVDASFIIPVIPDVLPGAPEIIADPLLPGPEPVLVEEVEDPGIPGDPNYLTATCGNGIRQQHEVCDDGNDSNFDDCNNVCQRVSCGNAVLEIREECDDGRNDDGDGCSARCLYERCGNFRIDTINDFTEQCDDGNLKAGDGCSRACTFEICGNSILDPGEQCDNGDNNNDAGPCTTCCKFEPACPVETSKSAPEALKPKS